MSLTWERSRSQQILATPWQESTQRPTTFAIQTGNAVGSACLDDRALASMANLTPGQRAQAMGGEKIT